jgi:hypothetical protein
MAFEVFSFEGEFERGSHTVDVWASPASNGGWFLDGFKVQ